MDSHRVIADPPPPPPPPKRESRPRMKKLKNAIPDPPRPPTKMLSQMALRKKDVTELSDMELYYVVHVQWLPNCYGYLVGIVKVDTKIQTLRVEYPKLQKIYRQLRESQGFDLDENPNICKVQMNIFKEPCCPNSHPESYAKYMSLAKFTIGHQTSKLRIHGLW